MQSTVDPVAGRLRFNLDERRPDPVGYSQLWKERLMVKWITLIAA